MTFKKAEKILSKHPLPPSFPYKSFIVSIWPMSWERAAVVISCLVDAGKCEGAPPSVLGPGGTRHAWGEYLLKRYWLSAAWRPASLPEVSPEVSHLLGEFYFLIQAVGVCAARTRPMQPNGSRSGSSPEP